MTGAAEGKRGSELGAIGSLAKGYDVNYLLKESGKSLDPGYYLSAVDSAGEPPGVWTGDGCAELGLTVGAEIDPAVMERMYGRILDPRDPAFYDDRVPDREKTRLGSAPRRYKTTQQNLADLAAAEPDAGPERMEQLQVKAAKMTRHALMFLDWTLSIDKSITVLHAGLLTAAARAGQDGAADAAAEHSRQARVVEAAIMAGKDAGLAYGQQHAGYSRSGHHGKIPRDDDGRPLAEHATGKFVDAHGWIVGSFLQHTSRDDDPQLHVHNAILNRVRCEDGEWRTLDSRAIYRALPAMNAVAARVTDEMIARELGIEFAALPGGRTREIRAVPQEVKDLFSSRRAVITQQVAELAAEYEKTHNRPPSARALWSMAQHATLSTRQPKPRKARTRGELLDEWAARAKAAELCALEGIPARAEGTQDPEAPGISVAGDAELDRMLAAAVAAVQARYATWTRAQLLHAIDEQLPAWLGGLPADRIIGLLDELTDRVLAQDSGLLDLEADLIPAPASLLRADGRLVYSPHDRSVHTTKQHQDAEERLLAAGGETGGPAVSPERAAALLGASPGELAAVPARRGARPAPPEHRGAAPESQGGSRYASGLRADQAAAVHGILTSGRPVDLLIGPAGAGKSHAMSVLSSAWATATGGRVIGVAVAEAAAQVLRDEGMTEAHNIARFLAMHARDETGLAPGDLLVVDEASMVGTAELTALHAIAAGAGAKLLLTGDPAQLPSVGAGGMFGLLAERHGWYELTEVQRMRETWEREASLRLRAGDADVLADYDRRGRLTEGTAEQMSGAAYRAWLADYLRGRDTLLVCPTNQMASGLSARARHALAEAGLVSADAPALLADGNRCGTGDLVQARRNSSKIEDAEGRMIVNRDIWRIEGFHRGAVTVRRSLGSGRWSRPFPVPASYLKSSAILGYASTVHSAQGRTVDTCHAVTAAGMSRAAVYVAMTRGRIANYSYSAVEPGPGQDPGRSLADQVPGRQAASDLRPGPRPAPQLADPGPDAPEDLRVLAQARADAGREGTEAAWAPEANRFSVLAAALELDDAEANRTATGTRRDEILRQRHMAHLGAIWASEVAEENARRCDHVLRDLLPAAQHQRYLAEPARAELHRQVRAAALAGRDPARILAGAGAVGALEGNEHRGDADSISKVLHWRIAHATGNPPPVPASHAARTPDVPGDPELSGYLQAVARLLDDRQAELGRVAAVELPPWAARLGPVPEHRDGREEWIRRASAVAAYREEFGYLDKDQPIGREPEAPEARASWRAAALALGTDPAQLDLARRSDGELHKARARYRRELASAPAHVGDDLRRAIIARREHETEATIANAIADGTGSPATRRAADEKAREHQRLAGQIAEQEETLTAASEARASWYEQTSEIREDALAATAELRRRGVDVGALEEPAGTEKFPQETGETGSSPDPAQVQAPRTAADLAALSTPRGRVPLPGRLQPPTRPRRPQQNPNRDRPGKSR